MTPELRLIVCAGLLGCFLAILACNTLAAAASYTRRERRREFPLGRCALAATGPSTLPFLTMASMVGLSIPGAVIWIMIAASPWASHNLERWLPQHSPRIGGGLTRPRRDRWRRIAADIDRSPAWLQFTLFPLIGPIVGALLLSCPFPRTDAASIILLMVTYGLAVHRGLFAWSQLLRGASGAYLFVVFIVFVSALEHQSGQLWARYSGAQRAR